MRSQKQAEYISTGEVEAEYGKLNAVKSNGRKPGKTRRDPLYEFIRNNLPNADADRVVLVIRIVGGIILAAISIWLVILGVYWMFRFILSSFAAFSVVGVIGMIVTIGFIVYAVASHWNNNRQ